jgi:hypothetical protein
MTVALFDKTGAAVAIHGAEIDKISEVPQLPAYINVAADAEDLFSAMLGDSLEVVKVSQANSNGVRLVAIHPLDLGPSRSSARSSGPAAPPRWSARAPPSRAPRSTTRTSAPSLPSSPRSTARTPPVGASDVFRVGENLGARIGAVGRVPGPAGTGDRGTLLVVLSDKTAAAGQKELLPALKRRQGQRHDRRARRSPSSSCSP